ncbi:MAG: sigma-70 family RNA polymerase sigma factor [Actinobacteria bacterium]|nr:sigma-70 family RNA polymerase sigma factor [Actinomycetota bacterium]
MGDRCEEPGVRRIEEFYRIHHRSLCNFFVRKGIDQGVAEDLTQDVFLRVLRSGREITGDDYGRNLLYRVAQNLVIDYFRKSNGSLRFKVVSPEELGEENGRRENGDHDPEELYLKNEAIAGVREAMSRLPRRYAQVIMLKEYGGLSYREIAARMGTTEKAVESLLHRARSHLKKDLVEKEGPQYGWWSSLLVSLHHAGSRIAARFLSALSRCAECAGSWSWGIPEAARSWNALLVFILAGSLVGAGVMTASHSQNEGVRENAREAYAAERLPEDVPPLSEKQVVVAAPAAKGPERPEAHAPEDSPAVTQAKAPEASAGEEDVSAAEGFCPLRSLVAGGCEAARFIAEKSGAAADLLCALGGYVTGFIAEPLLLLCAFTGMPDELVSSLESVARLETLRACIREAVRKTVDLTYKVEKTLTGVEAERPGGVVPAGVPGNGGGDTGEAGAEAPAVATCIEDKAGGGKAPSEAERRPKAATGREPDKRDAQTVSTPRACGGERTLLEKASAGINGLVQEAARTLRELLSRR